MPGDGRYLGPSAGVPELRPCGLLRFLQEQTRHQTLPSDQTPHRASRSSRAKTGAGAMWMRYFWTDVGRRTSGVGLRTSVASAVPATVRRASTLLSSRPRRPRDSWHDACADSRRLRNTASTRTGYLGHLFTYPSEANKLPSDVMNRRPHSSLLVLYSRFLSWFRLRLPSRSRPKALAGS